MQDGRTTLSKFLIDTLDRQPCSVGTMQNAGLSALLIDVAAAIKSISAMLTKGALGGNYGSAQSINTHGEEQKKLDVATNEIFVQQCEWDGLLAAMASEEMETVYSIPPGYPRGDYLLAFDPLDGSSNIGVDMTVGTIFSIFRAPEGVTEPGIEDFLQRGANQIAAGYALYGPVTMMVTTFGAGVHGFTLDRDSGTFELTHPNLRIPETAQEFAINVSNQRFWEAPVKQYIAECIEGAAGPRGVDFNMRWIASLVAEVHRILIRGGIFMYPRDTKDRAKAGRLRLIYEANPMAMLVEQAGGLASTGRQRILDVAPQGLHQRVPVILGAKLEVERLVRYHEAYDRGEDLIFETPLFHSRSLFRSL